MLTLTIKITFFITVVQSSVYKIMKLTKRQLYLILHELKPHRNQYPDLNASLQVVAETLNINPDDKLHNELKKTIKIIYKILQK